MTEPLTETLVTALQEAAEAEAAAYLSDVRPVMGTWGDRILEGLHRHGVYVAQRGDLAAALHANAIGCDWRPVDEGGHEYTGTPTHSECKADHAGDAAGLLAVPASKGA